MNSTRTSKIRIRGLRWWIFAFFVLVMIVNYIDRASLSIAMPFISKDLHMNAVVQGLVLSAFGWTYALMQLPGGWIVDKLRPRKVVAGSLVGWGIAEALTGLATGVATLTGARMLLGIFEGPVQNGANTSLTRWLRRDERGRGSTLVDSGGPLGTAIGGLVVTGLIIGLGSWRISFAVIGLVTVAIGLIAWIVVRDNPSDHPWITEEETAHLADVEDSAQEVPRRRLVEYLTDRSVWLLLLAFFGYDAVIFGLLTWAPSYLSEEQGISFAVSGFWLFVIFGAGFLGEMFAGQFADRMIRRGANPDRLLRIMLGAAGVAVAIAILLVNEVDTPVAAVLLISLANFFLRWGGLYWSVPARIAHPSHVGKITGAMNFSGNVAGILAPILIGVIVQATGHFHGVFVMFAIAGLVMAVGSIGIRYAEYRNKTV